MLESSIIDIVLSLGLLGTSTATLVCKTTQKTILSFLCTTILLSGLLISLSNIIIGLGVLIIYLSLSTVFLLTSRFLIKI
jgi:hypothetical protein